LSREAQTVAITMDNATSAGIRAGARAAAGRTVRTTDLTARGEPAQWLLGGALALGITMIVGLLALVFWNGIVTFWPKPIEVIRLTDGSVVAGEAARSESYRVPFDVREKIPAPALKAVLANDGHARRTLIRTGNYDLYNDDFKWVSDFDVKEATRPAGMFFFERLEWGVAVGKITKVMLDNRELEAGNLAALYAAHDEARSRWRKVRHIERRLIGDVNHDIEAERLYLRRLALRSGVDSAVYKDAEKAANVRIAELRARYEALSKEAQAIKDVDTKFTFTFAEVSGKEKTQKLSDVVRLYPANEIGFGDKLKVYAARWGEFLTDEPREANTEGGVLPAIFGTFTMTLLMVVAVAPFGVITALYLREYAKQGRLVSVVRISVNNLAGVPSIVYGVFGLGFFAYIFGGTIDQLFFPERLPSPTFGTGGLLWSSLTLALLTVPVVIVATEEALAAVPRSTREGSLACGASKWQTIQRIVLPRAMPGIMTGLILAMARGAGEVAPLMLVGVVKLAPELPIDHHFPFVHLERSFMHLGFHIYDVGFQSRNSEAGKPMVFVTTLLLIALIFVMNITAIMVRNRLKRRFAGSTF
jgi:phosphate transport system permease protein